MAAVLLGSGKARTKRDSSDLWEDKEVRFDISISLRPGEKVIDKLDFVEDTKGNNGDKGRLIVTNLRIMWHSLSIIRISLSIGLNCVVSASTKIVNSKLRGTTQALHLLTKFNNSRFEFIFTNLVSGNTRHFTSVMGVHKAYLSSKPYRELKLRGAVVRNKQLVILPLEQICNVVDGVWNLSSDQVKIRDSRFGPALVVESRPGSGSYVLGFKIDPPSRLHEIAKELSSMYEIHSATPELGVEYSFSDQAVLAESIPVAEPEVVEIEEEEVTGVVSAHYSEGGQDRAPVYSPHLGLAIESLPEGQTISTLWQIVPSNA